MKYSPYSAYTRLEIEENHLLRTATDNFWLDTPYEASPALRAELEADIAIMGGGFTGLTAVYFIKERFPGKRVIVLEGEYVGFGSSGRNSGGVTGRRGAWRCTRMILGWW